MRGKGVTDGIIRPLICRRVPGGENCAAKMDENLGIPAGTRPVLSSTLGHGIPLQATRMLSVLTGVLIHPFAIFQLNAMPSHYSLTSLSQTIKIIEASAKRYIHL